MTLLVLIGLGVTGYLIWSSTQVGPIAGCSAEGVFNCDHVLQSRWSKVMGVPVSVPGAAIYFCLLGGLMTYAWGPESWRKAAWLVVTASAVAAAGAATWFISLQVFQLGHLCQYCMVVHCMSLLLAGIALTAHVLSWGQLFKVASVGVVATLSLVVVQRFGPVPKSYEVEFYQASSEEGEDFETFDFDEFDMDLEASDEEATEALALDVSAVEVDPAKAIKVDPVAAERPTGLLPVETTTPPPSSSTSPVPAIDDAAIDDQLPPQPSSAQPVAEPQEVTTAVSKPLPPPTPSLTPAPPEDQQPPAADAALVSSEVPKRYVNFPAVRAKLNVRQWPLLGSPDAEHVFVELFDYSCAHCRKMHRHLKQVQNRYGDRVAIMVLPVPLDGKCNHTIRSTGAGHENACELARLALAVWRLNPEAFPQYHDFLLGGSRTRGVGEARGFAEKLVDPVALRSELQDKLVTAYLGKHVKIYQRTGLGQLPKLFSEHISLSGAATNADELCREIERGHGLR
ncbi:MAG: vitamin K epoxide reductase family protein [Planctomycetota bacterium]